MASWRDTIQPVAESAPKSWRDTIQPIPEEPSLGSKIQDIGEKYVVNQLPGLGAVAGGIAGGVLGNLPGGVAGAGAGGYLGKATQNLYNSYMHPDQAPKDMGEAIGQPVEEGLKSAGLEVLGAGAGKVLGKIAEPITSRVGSYLRDKAAQKAVAATGATGVQASKFAPNAGRELLDRGIVKFGSGQQAIAERAEEALQNSGENIGQTLDQLSSQGVKVDRRKIIETIKAKIAELAGNEGEKPLVNQLKARISDIEEQIPKAEMKQVGFRASDKPETIIQAVREGDARLADPFAKKPARYIHGNTEDQWEKLRGAEIKPAVKATPIEPRFAEVPGNSEIPVGKSEEIKRSFDKASKWESNADSAVRDANKVVANAYRQASEESATAANPELASTFKSDKDTYSLLSPIAKAAQRRAMTLNQSPPGGLLDTAAAAVGGGPGVIARRILAPRANSMMAVTADSLGSLIEKFPENLGKYAPMLQQAAARGSVSLMTKDKMLREKDPEYAATVDDALNKMAAPEPTEQKTVLIKTPSGKVKSIPIELKDQALAAGGTLVK